MIVVLILNGIHIHIIYNYLFYLKKKEEEGKDSARGIKGIIPLHQQNNWTKKEKEKK